MPGTSREILFAIQAAVDCSGSLCDLVMGGMVFVELGVKWSVKRASNLTRIEASLAGWPVMQQHYWLMSEKRLIGLSCVSGGLGIDIIDIRQLWRIVEMDGRYRSSSRHDSNRKGPTVVFWTVTTCTGCILFSVLDPVRDRIIFVALAKLSATLAIVLCFLRGPSKHPDSHSHLCR